MKRIILLAMSIIFSICSLVGCGDNTSDTYPEVTSEPVATSTTDSEQKNNIVDSNSIVEDNHFNITRTEFINKYDELFDELYDNAFKGINLADVQSYIYECDNATLQVHPNAYKMYSYDATLYTSGIQERLNKFVQIIVDKDDNVINVSFVRLGTALQTKEQFQHYVYVECTAVYMAITGETNAKTAMEALYEAYCSPENGKKGNYEYGFIEKENYDTSFNIRVINQ